MAGLFGEKQKGVGKTYDHMSRVKQVFHTVNAQPEILLTQNAYNEIGQLVDKGLYSTDNGATVKQSVDYRYNIRGWLSSMNNSQLANDGTTNDDTNDLFGFQLGYNNSIGTGNASLYNGNISAMKWSSNQAQGTVKDVGYNYSYDALNRITGASYLSNTAGVWANATGAFNESGYTYDMNGNIKNLTRNGSAGSAMDNMTYTYTGNQLLGVSDAADKTKGFIDGANTGNDYTYDINGNMVSDQNKSLTATNAIQYNHLNLPTTVIKSTNEKIVYTYDAGGRKLKQDVYNASNTIIKTTDYDGEFIYQGDTLQFINHDEGRVVMKNVASPEYQYHLKDHLGNVRVTFTSVPINDANTGTYETSNMSVEQSKFLRYANARRISATIFDHTNGSNPGYSERLNGGTNEVYGLARSISVMPGDVISCEVYAKYADPVSSNWNSALTTLMANIASNTGGIVVDGSGYGSSTSSFPSGFIGLQSKTDDGAPKAYLNWLVFDRNYVLQPSLSGYKQITTAGKEEGTDVPHEYLSSGNITITQPGYVYIYLSNENSTPVEVYFDDFKVTQTNTLPVVQQEDFYPFGLSFNSYSRENLTPQNYLYNSKERINDLSLNWDDFGARMYDPTLGRWWVIDPKSEKGRRWSPYVYAFDNPMRFIDPDGMWPDVPNWLKFVPSQATVDKFNQAKENLSKVFEGEASVSGKIYGAGAKAQVGPLKLEGSANVVKVTGKVNQDGAELSIKNITAEGSAKIASAKAEVSFTGAEGKLTINKDGVKGEGKALESKFETSIGENGFEMTADNSTKIGLGASISVVKVEGSVNIGAAVKGVANLVGAGLQYAADIFSFDNRK